MQHAPRLVGSLGSPGTLVPQLLAALLLHHSPVVRRSALKAATACAATSAELGIALLAAQQRWLREPLPAALLSDPSSAAEDPGLSRADVGGRHSTAVATVAAAAAARGAVPAEMLGRLLLIANHPTVTVGRTSHRASWDAVCRYKKIAFGHLRHVTAGKE